MFKVGDKVRRLYCNHGDTVVGGVYTIKSMIDSNCITSFEEFENYETYTYQSENFELVVPEQAVNYLVKSEAEIVKEWIGKLMYLAENHDLIGVPYKIVVYTEYNDTLTDEATVDFVINSYSAYKAKEDEKKKQELLDKKAQLELELAQINKELGSDYEVRCYCS